ncbi:MAG: hypothetical protein IKG93_01945, partial [Clostridiales bacterium]|nr:hypothetical protein [Clostridiales bacterium]
MKKTLLSNKKFLGGTSLILATSLIVGTMAFKKSNKDKGLKSLYVPQVYADASVPYDSASQINYATVLGGAVDYGIVAPEVHQKNHMETTFATKLFSNRDNQGNSNNNDVDYISSTALFLIGALEGDDKIRWGNNQVESMYLEAPEEVFGSTFDPTKPAKGNTTNGNIIFDSLYGDTPLIQAVNANANSNVDRLISRIGEKPAEGTTPEDADIAWSYYLQARSQFNSAYVLNPNGWNCNYFTNQNGESLDGNGNGKLNINIDSDEFAGKVVYINLDSVLLKYLTRTGDFIIHKDPSTVVVVNIDQSALDDTTSLLKLSKPLVEVNGTEYDGTTPTNGANWAYAEAVQKNFNETVIWNVMVSNPVQVSAMGGAMLIPNSSRVTIKEGNSSGWIVTGAPVDVRDEFHFLYGGSSRDHYGQMHFALNKTFTQEYKKQGEIEKDASISTNEGDFRFILQEYKSNDFSDPNKYGNPIVKTNDEYSAVIFNSFTFYCSDPDNLTDAQKHYYIEKPSGDEPNSKTFYFRVSEDPNKKKAGIENSDGYIDIILVVDVDKNGKFTYFVNYKSVTGNGIVYRDYAPDDNGDYHLDYIKMSGVQFDLGQFYNKVSRDLTICKVAIAGGEEINGAVLTIKRVGGDDSYNIATSAYAGTIKAFRTNSDNTTTNYRATRTAGIGGRPNAGTVLVNDSENSISYTTNNRGHVTIKDLPDGDYELIETVVPDSGIMGPQYHQADPITFSIVGGKVASCSSANGNAITMIDEVVVTLDISKAVLGAGDEVNGATLSLKSIDGLDLSAVQVTGSNVIKQSGSLIQYVTSSSSNTTLSNLPAGRYTLTENAAPNGFAVQSTIRFTVATDGTVTIDNELDADQATVQNNSGLGQHSKLTMFDAIKVNIRKVKQDNNILSGAVLQIYEADGTTKVGNSFASGEASVNLAVGNYILREEQAPSDYRKAEDIAFSVLADGTVKIGDSVQNENRITMVDLPGIKIKVQKRFYDSVSSGQFNALAGAKMQLTAEDGSVGNDTWTWTSGNDYHEITGLSPNVVYVLSEATPPSGYSKIVPIRFTVSESNYQTFINLEDDSILLQNALWTYQSGYSYDSDGYAYLEYTDKLNVIDDVSTTQTGYIKITKTINGDITDEDRNGLTFVVTDETGTVVWTGELGDTADFDVDTNGKYTSKDIEVDASKK